MIRWNLYDPETGFTFPFELNPSDARYRPLVRPTESDTTTKGRRIVYQGERIGGAYEISGAARTLRGRAILNAARRHRSPMILTDDRGSEFRGVVTALTWTTAQTAAAHGRHTFQMTFTRLLEAA